MKERNNFKNLLCRLPGFVFFLTMITIFSICTFLSKRCYIWDYLGASEPNIPLLLFIGVLVTTGIFFLGRKFHLDTHIVINKKFLICAFILSFVLQVIATYHYYFLTDWDVRTVFRLSSAIAHHEELSSFSEYFSRYPNNLVLASFFSTVISLVHKMGFHELEYFSLIVIQCLLNTVAGLLVMTAIKQLFHDDFLCLIGYLFYLGLAGISPWVVVPYSDSMGLIFPVLIFNIYLYHPEKKGRFFGVLKWFSIVFLSYIGYKIKPQILILFLGILVVEIYTNFIFWDNLTSKLRQFIRIFAGMILGLLMAVFLSNAMAESTNVPLDSEQAFGPTHFLMMGIHPETHGGYNRADVDFSLSFPTIEVRKTANLQVARERLEAMGISGFSEHLLQKVLYNFNDGSFFWGGEGVFYKEVLPEKNHSVSSFFRNLYYNRETPGKYYSSWYTFTQLLWITVLFFTIPAGLLNKEKKAMAAMTSLIGLTLFELLFEARSRYLFAYVPIYIIVAICGMKFLFNVWEKRKNKTDLS